MMLRKKPAGIAHKEQQHIFLTLGILFYSMKTAFLIKF